MWNTQTRTKADFMLNLMLMQKKIRLPAFLSEFLNNITLRLLHKWSCTNWTCSLLWWLRKFSFFLLHAIVAKPFLNDFVPLIFGQPCSFCISVILFTVIIHRAAQYQKLIRKDFWLGIFIRLVLVVSRVFLLFWLWSSDHSFLFFEIKILLDSPKQKGFFFRNELKHQL